jgi:hypothetical protein
VLLWRRVSACSPKEELVRGLSPKASEDETLQSSVSVCELRTLVRKVWSSAWKTPSATNFFFLFMGLIVVFLSMGKG